MSLKDCLGEYFCTLFMLWLSIWAKKHSRYNLVTLIYAFWFEIDVEINQMFSSIKNSKRYDMHWDLICFRVVTKRWAQRLYGLTCGYAPAPEKWKPQRFPVFGSLRREPCREFSENCFRSRHCKGGTFSWSHPCGHAPAWHSESRWFCVDIPNTKSVMTEKHYI